MLTGQPGAEHVKVSFIVETERPVIKISRAHRAPLTIDDHELAVHHGRHKLKQRNARAQHAAPASLRSPSRKSVVGAPTRHQHTYQHTALRGSHQGVYGQPVGHKVRTGDVDAAAGCSDSQQKHQLHALGATAGRTAEHLRIHITASLKRRKVSRAVQHVAADLDPVVQEHRLHLRHHRTGHRIVHVAPVPGVLRIAGPLRAYTHAAGETQATIDDEQLAVRAVV